MEDIRSANGLRTGPKCVHDICMSHWHWLCLITYMSQLVWFVCLFVCLFVCIFSTRMSRKWSSYTCYRHGRCEQLHAALACMYDVKVNNLGDLLNRQWHNAVKPNLVIKIFHFGFVDWQPWLNQRKYLIELNVILAIDGWLVMSKKKWVCYRIK